MSGEALFSAHWHRVHDVVPRLAADVVATRHVNRGRVSWVLKRRSGGDPVRLDAISFALIERLDGKRCVGKVWEAALLEHDHDAPSQDEWITLLADLHAAELLVVEQRDAAQPVFERRERRRKRERRERHLNPLYLRFTLYDPDRLLTRLAPWARRVFSRPVWIAWCALLGAGALALLVGWPSLVDRLDDPLFPAPRTVALVVLAYPLLKLAHELAHGLAVKRFGGAVHECGVALMVLMPVPYVDAGASAAFADRRQRLLVGGAGILVELAIAAIGALLWVTATGSVQEAGLVLLLLGGLSTLLINGNPLLRFDGYYLLVDALEIPELATRARRATLTRLRAWLGGEHDERRGFEDARERGWLLAYGVLSALYRTGLMLWIAWWLSGRYPLIGGVLALFAIVSSVLLPLWRGLRVVWRDPSLHGTRSWALLGGVPALLVALSIGMPLPRTSATTGVVWLPEEAVVRAPGLCEILVANVRPGAAVSTGEPLFECADPELVMRERELLARADELSALAAGLMNIRPREYERLLDEHRTNATELADVRTRRGAGRHVAALDGRFDVPGTHDLTGRVLQRGDVAAYVVPDHQRTIRVAIGERAAGRVDESLRTVELRLAHAAYGGDGSRVHRTRILSRTPRPARELASAALGQAGGGEHANDPTGNDRQVLDPLFDLELAWPEGVAALPIGAHVSVRFVHAPVPLGARIADRLRRAVGERTLS